MSILFVSRNFSEDLFLLLEELAKTLPIRYVYMSENEREYFKSGVEIKQVNKENLEQINNYIENINSPLIIFSDVHLAKNFSGLSGKVGVMLDGFVSTKYVSKFDFIITFFSTLKQFYKDYTRVVKINPFVDLDRIKNLKEQRLWGVKGISKVYSFMIISHEISEELNNLLSVLEKIRNDGIDMSINVLTKEESLTHLSHISFIKNSIEESKFLSLLSLSDVSVFMDQNVFGFAKSYSLGVCPIVSSRTLLFEYIWNEKTGFVVPFDDKKIVEKSIKKCIEKLPIITRNIQKSSYVFDVKSVANDFINQLKKENLIEEIKVI